MGTIADGPRTGYGLTALRKRYIRRAEYLIRDRDFIKDITAFRSYWIGAFPRIPLGLGVAPDDYCMPLSTPENTDLSFWPEHEEAWVDAIIRTHDRYFPLEDFYSLFHMEPTASRFIATCFDLGPRAIDDCAALIPELQVGTIRGVLRYMMPVNRLYLPLHPGITAKDLRDAASSIAEEANVFYGARMGVAGWGAQTPEARTIALRAEGLTHRQIANRLGLTEQTVAAVLRNTDTPTTEYD